MLHVVANTFDDGNFSSAWTFVLFGQITHFLDLKTLFHGFSPDCCGLERLLHFDVCHFLCVFFLTITSLQVLSEMIGTKLFWSIFLCNFCCQIISSLWYFSQVKMISLGFYHSELFTFFLLLLPFFDFQFSTFQTFIFVYVVHCRTRIYFTPKKLFNEFLTLQNSCLNYVAAAHSCSQAVGNWHENWKFSQNFFDGKKIVSFLSRRRRYNLISSCSFVSLYSILRASFLASNLYFL